MINLLFDSRICKVYLGVIGVYNASLTHSHSPTHTLTHSVTLTFGRGSQVNRFVFKFIARQEQKGNRHQTSNSINFKFTYNVEFVKKKFFLLELSPCGNRLYLCVSH